MGKCFGERLDSRLERVNGNWDLRLIANAFTLAHCYGPTYTVATATRGLSEPSNPLFPPRRVLCPKAVPFPGPQNLIDLHPVLQFQLKAIVTAAFAWNWYWRESTHDGIYAFGSGAVVDPADASHARYLGNQGDLEIRWAPHCAYHRRLQLCRQNSDPKRRADRSGCRLHLSLLESKSRSLLLRRYVEQTARLGILEHP